MEAIIKNSYITNFSPESKSQLYKWKQANSAKYISVESSSLKNSNIQAPKSTNASLAWYPPLQMYVNINALYSNTAEISYTTKISDENQSVHFQLMRGLFEDSTCEPSNEEYVLDFFFERLTTPEKEKVIPIPTQKNVTIKELVSKSSIIIQIPITIIECRDIASKMHINIDCNVPIEDLCKYIKEVNGCNTTSLYSKDGIIQDLRIKLYEKVVPRQILFAVAKTQYSIYKRLEISSGSWSNDINNWDAIKVQAKRPVLICGYSGFALSTNTASKELVYQFKLNGAIVRNGKIKVKFENTNKLIKIELPPNEYLPVVEKDSLVIMQYIEESSCYRGKKYNGPPQPDVFKIVSSSESENGTSETDGQFPEIFYI